MSDIFDYVVVGGGHNGLTAACYLAKAGHSVAVVEKRPVAGGMAISEPLVANAPHHLLSPGAIDTVFIRQTPILEELQLADYGLELLDIDPGYGWVNDDGDTLMLFRSVDRTAEDIRRFSAKDAHTYRDLANSFDRILKLQAPFMSRALPDVRWRDLVSAAWKLVADRDMRKTLGRLLSVSAYEAIAETFESDALRGLYAYWCAIACPPNAANSGVYMASFAQIHAIGCSRPRGGMSALIRALSQYLEVRGGVITLNARADNITVEANVAKGVVLESGEHYSARFGVLSACAPQLTFGDLLEQRDCPKSIREKLTYMPANEGNMGPFKIDMALSGSSLFSKATAKRRAVDDTDINVASLMTGTLEDHLDHTVAVARGKMGKKPPIWMTLLAHADPSLAPQGQSTAYLYTSIPVCSELGTDTLREQSSDMLLNSARLHIDGLDTEMGRSVLMPQDFEQDYGSPNGCLYHVDMIPGRLGPLRPAKGMGGSTTEISALYLAGSGSHPGGGVFGLPGKFAAQSALANNKSD